VAAAIGRTPCDGFYGIDRRRTHPQHQRRLFGFQESIRASFVVESILLESIGAAILLAWTVIVLHAQGKRRERYDHDLFGSLQ
jgi:hypothetical protein